MNEFKQESILFARSQAIAEKQILPIVRKTLKQSIQRVIQYANDFGLDTLKPEGLINPNVWDKMYLNIYQSIGMKLAKQEFYRQRALDTGTKASAIEFLVDIWSGVLREYALKYTYQISRELNQTTIDIINRALGEDYELGLGRDGIVRLFENNLNTAMRTRSLVISRTEATTISNIGKDIGARSWIEQQGGGGKKVWLGRNDAKERPSHLQENDTILDIDDKYNLNGELAERPGDVNLSAKNRINCRCTQSLMSENRYNQLVKRGRIVDGKLIGAS